MPVFGDPPDPAGCLAGIVDARRETEHVRETRWSRKPIDRSDPAGDGQCRLRLRAHGEDIPQCVIRRNSTEHIGIVDKCAKIIDGLQYHFARRPQNPLLRRRT